MPDAVKKQKKMRKLVILHLGVVQWFIYVFASQKTKNLCELVSLHLDVVQQLHSICE